MSPSVDTLTKIIHACELDLLVRLVEREPQEWSSVQATDEMTPEERLDKLVTFVDTMEEGRPVRVLGNQSSANG